MGARLEQRVFRSRPFIAPDAVSDAATSPPRWPPKITMQPPGEKPIRWQRAISAAFHIILGFMA